MCVSSVLPVIHCCDELLLGFVSITLNVACSVFDRPYNVVMFAYCSILYNLVDGLLQYLVEYLFEYLLHCGVCVKLIYVTKLLFE